MTTQTARCPRCGEGLPAGIEARDYEGICPRCLAFLAVEEGADPGPGAGAEDPLKLAAKDPPPLKRGATFHGMEVLELVGQGGMGVVYKARQIELDRVVALKILSPRLASDEEFPRRFAREAKALASLDHPNIVRVHDVGREGDLTYLVMEYVDGVNLRDLLIQKKINPEQALRVVPQLCEALEYAHSRGIIHRDIKPENILVDRSGAAKIADFGLAKILKDDKAAVRITQTNVIMGTADYMAPEQRDSLKVADHRADIYSLGVVFYELLTGELPVGRFDPPSRRFRLDGRVDDIVLKALERDPDRRYQQASHMGREVGEIAASGPAPATDCPIVDTVSGRLLGTAPSRRLAVRTVDCPLRVEGWDRPHIGLRVVGDYQFDPAGSTPLLQSQVETREVVVQVPRGVELDLVAAEGAVRIDSVAGHVEARVPEGRLEVLRHEGSLRVHAGQGSVAIDGLKSEYFEVRARSGSVSITGLDLPRGRGQVETESGSIAIRPAEGSSFRYYLESRSGTIEGPASGQVGGGAGWLTVRSVSGGLRLSPPAPAPVALEGFRDFLRRLTPKQVEKLGTFVIVNAALLTFFLALAGTAVPAICVAVVWGMFLGLEFWKSHVRETRLDGRPLADAVPRVVQKLMNLIPTPAPAAPAPPPAPAPPAPPARASWLAVLALLVALVGFLSAAGAAAAVLFEGETLRVRAGPRDVGIVRTVAFFAGSAGFLFGLGGLVLGVASSAHVREAQGRLKGKAAAQLAGIFSLFSLAAVLGYVRPQLREVQVFAAEARKAAFRFVQAIEEGRPAAAYEMLTDAAKSGLPLAEFSSRLERGRTTRAHRWKGLRPVRADVAPGGGACRVELAAGELGEPRDALGMYESTLRILGDLTSLELERRGSWRVTRVRDFVDRLGD